MKNDKISIVVPIYNMENYLNKCINSIINQTYSNIEILLIDDGSTDKSSEMCDNWEKRDNRIRVFHKKNGGLSDAKNYGIEHATGEYIGFVDSDDWIEHDMYEQLYNEAKNNKADIVICGRYLEYDNHTIEQLKNERIIMNSKEAIIKLNTFYGFDMSSCDKLYNINLFKNIRFPYGKKCEDAYVTYKLFGNAKKIEYFPKCFYHYLQRNNSISKNKLLNKDLVYAAQEQTEYISSKYDDIKHIGIINYAFSIKLLYEMAIERNIRIDEELKKYKKEIKEYKKIITSSNYLNKKKKIAFILFNNYYYIYYILKKIKKYINKNKLSR